MRRFAALFGLIGLFAATPAQAFDPARLGTMVEAANFAGSILVSRGDTIIYARAFGRVNPNEDQLHTLDARWRWASITKQIVATLVMQQVEAGAISFDAPISRYWNDFPNAHRNVITIRHLMRHMSGLPNPDSTPELPSGLPSFYGIEGAAISAADAHCAGRVQAQPGTRYAYTNCDFIVLASILERVSGSTLAELVAKHLPGNIALFPDGGETVSGYHNGQAEPPIRFAAYGGAGGLNGSIFDLWLFDRALMTGALLDDETRELMWDGDPATGHHAMGQWELRVRLAGCDQPVRVVERTGAIGGVQTRNYILPEQGIIVIAFTNRSEREFSFGQVWARQGFVHDLLAETTCHWDAS